MSLKLPASNSPLRELFDLKTLASLTDLANRAKLPTLRDAINSARNTFANEPAARSVNSLVLRADGSLHLMRFGSRGGKKTLWDFGKL